MKHIKFVKDRKQPLAMTCHAILKNKKINYRKYISISREFNNNTGHKTTP